MTHEAQTTAAGLPIFNPRMLIRPAIAWVTVSLFLIFGSDWMAHLSRHEIGLSLFAWLFFVIVWVAFGVVHEAEELAGLLGEPVLYQRPEAHGPTQFPTVRLTGDVPHAEE